MDENRLVEVKDLKVHFFTDDGVVKAVDGVSFHINKGETLAVVGESGSGKSVTSLAMMRLIPTPPGKIVGGQMLFRGKDGKLRDLAKEDEATMRRIRGNDIAMIFQEPMTSLNPVFTIGWQLMEAMAVHGRGRGPDTRRRAMELLTRVGLPEPERLLRQYPHELSGGMRQRVMIAMALANNPKLLIADEPTTALDVTVQKQILDLIRDLQQDSGMAVLLITHDLGIVAEVSDAVAVMYAGQIVEYAATRDLFRAPAHPYTRALFASRPSRDQRGRDLITIEGIVPQATAWPPACRFAPRCPERWSICETVAPVYQKQARSGADQTDATERGVRCHLYDPEQAGTRPERSTTLEVHP